MQRETSEQRHAPERCQQTGGAVSPEREDFEDANNPQIEPWRPSSGVSAHDFNFGVRANRQHRRQRNRKHERRHSNDNQHHKGIRREHEWNHDQYADEQQRRREWGQRRR